jgi:hypothetical protein
MYFYYRCEEISFHGAEVSSCRGEQLSRRAAVEESSCHGEKLSRREAVTESSCHGEQLSRRSAVTESCGEKVHFE